MHSGLQSQLALYNYVCHTLVCNLTQRDIMSFQNALLTMCKSATWPFGAQSTVRTAETEVSNTVEISYTFYEINS